MENIKLFYRLFIKVFPTVSKPHPVSIGHYEKECMKPRDWYSKIAKSSFLVLADFR
jgi:hypothetical protein